MDVGRLSERVTIERPEITRDAFGGVIESWTLIASTWAAVEPLQGREFWSAAGSHAETTIRVRTRYMAGITAACRVVLDDGRVLDVQSVIDERNQHRYLQLMCRELA